MFIFRISETSSRVPLALFVLEITVFFAATLISAYIDLFPGTAGASLSVWLMRATVFGAAMIFSMLMFKLYQGRPNENIAMGLLRMAGSFMLGALILQAVYRLAPALAMDLPTLGMTMVLSFFFLGTVRPVFLDSVTARRGGLRSDRRRMSPSGQHQVVVDDELVQQPADRPRRPRSLTGQHRISRRGH